MTGKTLAQIAQAIGGETKGDASVVITQMGDLGKAQPHQLSFLSNAKFAKDLATTKAGGVILRVHDAVNYTGNAIIMSDPYVGFAKAAQLLDSTPVQERGIAPSAVVHPSAKLGDNVSVAAGAVVSAHAIVSDNVVIGANCFIGELAILGAGVNLRANVTIYHRVELGQNVSIHSGTVIGCDGFGYANEKGSWTKIPQTGTVVIGEGTEIGANCAIDRGAIGNTIIGKNCIIDNLVHIAHNVEIGDHSCICGATGIAGSAVLGKYVVVAGQCAINGHIRIADEVQITGQSMVTKSIKEAGVYSSGMPVAPNRLWQKNTVQLRQIGKLVDRVKALEQAAKNSPSK
ncbi:UDP-3-O-[3-hydroxymyristoyl] glucosamine N-acyltransferase [Glaciecola punicea ACAM 611]|jgi:UDP-3-O-[3-hydroxymyristoyl] glucosamine N-acyltransferase|uniref:UDP-3-O-acylglucosamine N-acyltransferase n=1 Tax=Glaciecola punicea ACAM 611 TaxID=1121923 RepID=H5T7S9_9ALTE|nr:UDP-3-O-(3-hydroxymyristoyl)glucosamine N-acyltransferase [Glaciecola punicea]GAB54356.1 UDP-3-O-[3-hydroxymyristoyl] glucosamine N-acyltransferase [Glaciecola punicea ACAM 611]